MMHSRAFLLLEREFKEYEEANIFGISISPVGDNLMEWLAEIKGLKDSLWEGAELQLSVKYTEDYNKVPPSINFTTIPFHPNVDPESGKPCVDFLDDPTKWDPKLTISSILLTIQVLLSNPVLHNAVNLEAAEMLQNHYSLYRKRVIQCVTTSQHLEAIPNIVETSESKFFSSPEEPAPGQVRKVTDVSYEDYYLTWIEIATSKTVENFKTPVFEDPNFIGNHYDWTAANVVKGEWDINIHRLLINQFIEKQKRLKLLEGRESSLHKRSTTPVYILVWSMSQLSSSTTFKSIEKPLITSTMSSCGISLGKWAPQNISLFS
ncbi:ubiquitin-conjugating enzyme E2 U isoform X2 [Hemicordylus capensis]|uniref:ubiquitin-conjugating enzyme E2 U isoform X2 n=1 Tax=Hemicordylus capensis TaxID=884348 RepID=UPI002303DF8E|nr:ubiquitin-conjugating enzyme E2 U isoform X2 [Hemicordylus capensis]